MIKIKPIVCVSALAVVGFCMYFAAKAAPQTATDGQTKVIVTATTAFLNSLSAAQREKVQFPFVPEETAKNVTFGRSDKGAGARGGGGLGGPEGRGLGSPSGAGRPGGRAGMGPGGGFVGEQYGQAVWSNFPVSDVPRPGLALGSLSTAQRDAVTRLLQVLLSPKGYQKVLEIMGSDQALSDSGTPFSSGVASYTLCIFGQPNLTSPWMLQYGGHHLALNIVVTGTRGVITPTLTGAQPSVYISNGKTVRALAQENDKAFMLLDTLDEAQRKQATLNYRIGDLVLGPGHAGERIQPEGLKATALNGKQRAMLLDLISEWAGIINDSYAGPRMEEIKASLDDTYFAWSGPGTHEAGKNGSAYYRIQGPKLVIEFSPQGVGGDPTNHVHTMYRDPTNDYGIKLTGAQ
ncbi:MAG TPA: DUF3500 domain-containing protein [Bryobacteraceae bacterium]|nr:DUF3500 domain-containing protein [Bryobacteraceae bacterium]